MILNYQVTASLAVLLLSPLVSADKLYTKNSPVLQLDVSSYDRHITKSNHTSIVEFYAPWCGHCQKLAPAFENAAKRLKGLAKVAAVNCDDNSNKAFCGQMGVKGYPTLKIIRPSKRKGGKHVVEDYQGERSPKAMVDAVIEKIPNHVKRVTDKSIEAWFKENNETAKAVLLTDKGTTSALLRALAIDFLGVVNVGQVRNKEKEAVEVFGIEKFPSFLVLPGGDQEAVVYDGELKKEAMKEFLTKYAAPNPDPAPIEKKKPKKPAVKESTVKEGIKPVDSKIKLEDAGEKKTEKKPDDGIARIPTLEQAELNKKCLASSSKSCVLVLLPEKVKEPPQDLLEAVANLLRIYNKHIRRSSSFPFYIIDAEDPSSKLLRETLGLKDVSTLELVAVNAKRNWWRHYGEEGFSQTAIEAWIDTIRMNEGKREKLPAKLVTKDVQDDDDEEEESHKPEEKEKTNKPADESSSAPPAEEKKIKDEL